MNDTISLHTVSLYNKRFTQQADPKECFRIYHQKIMYAAFLFTAIQLAEGQPIVFHLDSPL